jgi:hypothetical protein
VNGLTTSTLEGGGQMSSEHGSIFNDAKVVAADILTQQRVVHKIDIVLTIIRRYPAPTVPLPLPPRESLFQSSSRLSPLPHLCRLWVAVVLCWT